MKYLMSAALAAALLSAASALAQTSPAAPPAPTPQPAPQDPSSMTSLQDGQAMPMAMPKDDPQWQKGDQLPEKDRGAENIVSDWSGQNLHAPSAKQHWVHVDDRFLLVSLPSYIVQEVVLAPQQ